MTIVSAPGKVILCGEHAVVYHQPAIALPLADVRATATIENGVAGTGVIVHLPDLRERWTLADEHDHPLAPLLRSTLERLNVHTLPDLEITLQSAIPIASGMGSGAALAAALVKALGSHVAAPLPPAEVSRLVYESERFYHGTPSGIDNTVVSYEQPIWYVRGTEELEARDAGLGVQGSETQPPASSLQLPAATIESISIARPITLVIGDTGVRAPTRATVGGVRERWKHDPDHYNRLFAEIGGLVAEARRQLAAGAIAELGQTLDRNHELLRGIGVSSRELERLIDAARQGGALGAKLSGGGGGGIMLALVAPGDGDIVVRALLDAGATSVLHTTVG